MKTAAAIIADFAAAVADDAAVTAFCIEHFGRAHLVRIQEDPARPLRSADAPWVALLSWPGGQFGEIQETASVSVNVTCGVSDPLAKDPNSVQSVARVTRERTATQAGIEEIGDAALAEEFLNLTLAAIRSADCGALVESAGAESDGWSQYPLQVASSVLQITGEANAFQ